MLTIGLYDTNGDHHVHKADRGPLIVVRDVENGRHVARLVVKLEETAKEALFFVSAKLDGTGRPVVEVVAKDEAGEEKKAHVRGKPWKTQINCQEIVESPPPVGRFHKVRQTYETFEVLDGGHRYITAKRDADGYIEIGRWPQRANPEDISMFNHWVSMAGEPQAQ